MVKAKEMNSRCECPKDKEGLCQLIIKWIEDTYFWKTDPNFKRTYDNYARKKNEEWVVDDMLERIEAKLEILGLELEKERTSITKIEISSMAEILLNFEKHTAYY